MNKQNLIFVITLITLFSINSCDTPKNTLDITAYRDTLKINSPSNLTINILKGESFNHPTFVIWVENMTGEYLNTIFITRSYASGIFGHKMKNDSVWLNEKGNSYQPAALPYWTNKKGLIDGKYSVPEPMHQFVDAYTGATPQGNFKFETKSDTIKTPYHILLEVNQAWDWNTYWSNEKFPNSPSYKHSCQPSIIYAVIINSSDSVFYLNPIGHGSPTGETGKLYTDLSTLSTAKNIFKSIKITIKK